MPLIEVKRLTTFKSNPDGLNYQVRTWYYDTETEQNNPVVTDTSNTDEGNFTPPTTQLLDSYCRGTTRVDVYPAAALDGTARTEEFPNAAECPLPPDNPDPEPTPIGEGLEPDPFAPPGSLLVERICKSTPDGTFQYTDRYYDYATRSIVRLTSQAGAFANTCTNYRVPATEVIDRYCVEPGVAPFVERRVFFGTNPSALTYEDVEGVEVCQIPPCQFYLTVTAEADAEGLFTATLTPHLNTGAVLYQIEGSDDPPQEAPTFTSLPAGRITFVGTETRPDGCTARVSITLKAVYGIRYRVRYKDANNRACQLLLRKRGYTGPIVDLRGTDQLLDIDWPGGGLDHIYTTLRKGSEAEIRLLLLEHGLMLDTFSGDERLFRVESVVDNTLFWRGFLLIEQYTIEHLFPPNGFNLRATDGLGALDGIPFTGVLGERLSGHWSHLQVVQHCLGRLDLDLPLRVRMELYPRGASAMKCALEQVYVDVEAAYRDEKDKPWSCGKVLDTILDSYGLRVAQQGGALWLERISDLTLGARRYFAYNADGAAAGTVLAGRLRTITPPPPTTAPEPLYYLNANQTQSLLGAVSRVEVAADPSGIVNLLKRAAFLDPLNVESSGRPVGWSGTAPVQVLDPTKRDASAPLLIEGAAPGVAELATEFIQTPATTPVPANAFLPIRLRFKATLRSSQAIPPNLSALDLPTLYIAIRHGSLWLGDPAGGPTPQFYGIGFDRLDTVKEVETVGFRRYQNEADVLAPLQVRFLQVAAPNGHATYDVEITDLELVWAVEDQIEDYIDTTVAENDSLVTRQDTELQLYHTDTPGVRYHGTLLNALGYPTEQWYQPAQATQFAPAAAYLVADRFLAQRQPAQVLQGTLDGELRPFDILTDPQERERQAYYVFTSLRYSATDARWDFTAVQHAALGRPEGSALPGGTVLTEETDPVLTEEGDYVITEPTNTDEAEPPVFVREGRKMSALFKPTGVLGTDRIVALRTSDPDPAKRNIIPTVDQVKAYILTGLETGGAEARFTITPAVSDGDIQAGVTYTDISSEELWRLKLEPYARVSFSFFTIQDQGSQDVEVGTTFSQGFKSVKWGTNNSQNVKPNSISFLDVTAVATLASGEANDGALSASTSAFTATKGQFRRYRLAGLDTKEQGFSADIVYTGYYKSYFGYSTATNLDMAGLLALGNGQLQDGRQRTVSGVTATGGAYTYYAYEVSGGDITNIILDGAAPVLGAFQKLPDVSGVNALGAPVTLRVYRSNAPNAFLNNTLAFS